jgi:hypothetical protein
VTKGKGKKMLKWGNVPMLNFLNLLGLSCIVFFFGFLASRCYHVIISHNILRSCKNCALCGT